jgi:hypothetical protein
MRPTQSTRRFGLHAVGPAATLAAIIAGRAAGRSTPERRRRRSGSAAARRAIVADGLPIASPSVGSFDP